ncbi:MAG: AAA family ATPase [Defluviitaleaceae bacterium]|nr:AAA family ATPase [Defluviitaleaceae bacterium]
MVKQVVDKISDYIGSKKSFIMLGGAGSGKTYTLMQAIDLAVKKVGASKVCCVTYTNAAVDEIKRRCPYEKLRVGTMHDMLWEIISPYQKNAVTVFHSLIESGDIKIDDEEKKKKALEVEEVQYRDYRSLERGIFWHDDLLKIVKAMFDKYPLLLKIFADKFHYFFIDEYQDTVDVLIDICVRANKEHGMTVGLFGDSMQAIYEKNYKADVPIEELAKNNNFEIILKEDNFRCAKNVIELINKLRTDLIEQQAAGDNEDGKITFLYSMQSKTIDEIKSNAAFSGWSWGGETKQLFLTHKLIAKELGFENYLSAFAGFDNALAVGKEDSKRHRFTNYLFLIARILDAYMRKDYAEVLRYCDKPIKKLADKERIAKSIEETIINLGSSCLDVVEELVKAGVLKLPNEALSTEKEKEIALLDKLKAVSLQEVLEAYRYAESMTPFSTQHNIKGLEFDNVFVYLDNGKWNDYNFTKLFSDMKTKGSDPTIFERTLKLLYVCFSRAKKNLVVYFPVPNLVVLQKAKDWFGDSNVIEM